VLHFINVLLCVIMLSADFLIVMLSVAFLKCYTDCPNAEYFISEMYAECCIYSVLMLSVNILNAAFFNCYAECQKLSISSLL
jgi:hypothetical protein